MVRAVLPRVSLTQVQQVIEKTPVEIEVFGFGSLCVKRWRALCTVELCDWRIAQHPRRYARRPRPYAGWRLTRVVNRA